MRKYPRDKLLICTLVRKIYILPKLDWSLTPPDETINIETYSVSASLDEATKTGEQSNDQIKDRNLFSSRK